MSDFFRGTGDPSLSPRFGMDPPEGRVRPQVPPLVSIVIPSYNHRPFVADAIRSALAQTHPCCEVIVIDDGSTDGTPHVIESLLRESGGRFRCLLKRHEGLIPTLNRGLGLARGEYFVQFGSDDVLFRETAVLQVERLEADARLGLVCGDAYFLEGDRPTTRRILGARARKYFGRRDLYRELLLHNFIINLTVMFRRDALIASGGFDEAIPQIEDWDAVLRVAERHPIGYIDAPLGYYRLHPGNTHKRLAWMFSGILATLEKHFREGRFSGRRWFRRHVMCRVHYQYGKRRLTAGDPAGAVRSYLDALRYNPLYPRVYPKLVRAALRRGRGSTAGGRGGAGSGLAEWRE